jgi:hypothetical protein
MQGDAMATQNSFHDNLKERAWIRKGKLLIACVVAAILCWLFIQSAQSSSVLDKPGAAPNTDILNAPEPEDLAQISRINTKTHVTTLQLVNQGHFEIRFSAQPYFATGAAYRR